MKKVAYTGRSINNAVFLDMTGDESDEARALAWELSDASNPNSDEVLTVEVEDAIADELIAVLNRRFEN